MKEKINKQIGRAFKGINLFYLVSLGFLIWSGVSLEWMRFLVGIILLVITAGLHLQAIKLEQAFKDKK